MVVDQNHQSQMDTEPELLVMCIILVGQRCILGQGNLVVVLLILGDPGATSQDDAIFLGESLL